MTTSVHRWLLTALLALAACVVGCAPIVGDECTSDTDCGTGLICDSAQPDGYCTRKECLIEGCPDEGVCVLFDDAAAFCMKPCESDGDCRSDYVCLADFGPHPFCSIPLTSQD